MKPLEVIVHRFKYDTPSLETHLVTVPDEYPDFKQED